jgi:hypothetical protein
MRLVTCDNGLRALRGHSYNLALGLRVELGARGVALDLLAHATLDDAIASQLRARPTFHYAPHDVAWRNGRPDLARVGGRFADDLAAAQVDDADVLLVAAARANEIYGIAEWIARSGNRAPVVALNFMVDDFGDGPAWAAAGYREAFAHLFEVMPRERVVLSSSSASIAASIGALADAPVAVYPMPKFVPPLAGATRPRNAIPIVGVLGSFNMYDRAAAMPGIAAAAARSPIACRFLIQGPVDHVRLDRVDAYMALRAMGNVELTTTELDFNGYFSALFACDVVLLPYERQQYAASSSGIFAEAVAFAKIVAVPAGTWMSSRLEAGEGAGVVFERRDPDAVVAALHRAFADFAALSALAKVRAEAWRRSDGLPAFLDRLLSDVAARQSA